MDIGGIGEQRLFQRLKLHCDLELKASSPSGAKQVRLYNFSGGGLSVIGAGPWPELGKAQLKVYFSSQKLGVVYDGEILWRRQLRSSSLWQVGVRFAKPATRKTAYFLNYYSPGQH